MKRGRRILLIVAGCATVAAVTILVWPGEREPEYQGRKLSEWIKSHPPFEGGEEAMVAISQMGTNALPFLVAWVREAKPTADSKLDNLVYGTSRKLAVGRAWFRFRNKKSFRAMDAAIALGGLGRAGEPAIPGLMDTARGTNGAAAEIACRALEWNGTDAAISALRVLAVERVSKHSELNNLRPFLRVGVTNESPSP